MAEEGSSVGMFYNISLALIPSDALSAEDTDEIIQQVKAHGGEYVPLRENDQSIDLDEVTHVVSSSIDFPQYNAAIEKGVSVVKPSWVIQSLKKGKVASARQHSPDPSQYFSDVVLCCGELPEGDKEVIIAGVIALGGQYSGVLSKLVTHIVTDDLNDEKCQKALEKNLHCRIVMPHWFDDCLRLGKKISEAPYTYPNPPHKQATLNRPANSDSAHVEGATGAFPTNPLINTPPSSPSDARKNLNAFMGKKIKISADLVMSTHTAETLKGLIEYSGGTLTKDVKQADIYICHFRRGEDYVAASQAKKEVANLSWLYHVINQNKYTNPTSKLFHYPVPADPLEGFKNLKISISNYAGDARIYLENLVKVCGAEFTKTMKQDNTHLITAHTKSEKCDAAQEWNLNLVNHLWLEECYAQCKYIPASNPRYIHFPASTNLGEVCGLTTLNMNRVKELYFPEPKAAKSSESTKSSPRKTVPASSATMGSPRKSIPMTAPTPIAEDAEDVDMDGADDYDEPEEFVKHAKKATDKGKRASNVPAADEDEQADETEPQTAKKPRGRPRKSLATPARLVDEEKENVPPMLSTGRPERAAKRGAMENMSPYGQDMELFAKEMARKGGVTHGGRRSTNIEDFVSSPAPEPKNKKKRKSDEATYDVTAEGSELSDGETQLAKNTKKAKTAAAPELPPIRYRMMITGDERWIGNVKQESADRTKLRLLGVQLTQDPQEVDILCAPAIKRTRKFVAALANAPLVVDSKFLDKALKDNKLIENPSTLKDRDYESKRAYDLSSSLERAKVNQHKLLRGWSIFVMKDIPGGFETFKEIIIVNGGAALMYTGRTGLVLPKRRNRDDPEAGSESQHQGDDDEYDYIYLVSGTSEPEIKLWKTFRALAEKQGLQARIVKSDWLLDAAMSQLVSWNEWWALDEAALTSQRDR